MAAHELVIVISSTGEVRMHTEGVQGNTCLDYAEVIRSVVGETLSLAPTQDASAPDVRIDVTHHISTHTGRR